MRFDGIPQEGVKVIVGTRTYVGPDWLHVDIDPSPLWHEATEARHPVDVVAEAGKIPLPDNFADVVFSSECIEHISWRKTGDVIKEWARLVKPNGILVVDAPDFELAAKQLIAWDTLDGHLRLQQIFFAEQLNEFDIHLAGISHLTLPHFMEEAGLIVEDIQRGDTYGWLHCVGRKL